jgi:hypothetical protein
MNKEQIEKERKDLKNLLGCKFKNDFGYGVINEVDLLKGSARLDYDYPVEYNGTVKMPVWSFVYTNYYPDILKKANTGNFIQEHYSKLIIKK